MTQTQELEALRQQSQRSQERFQQTLGQISAKKAQLGEAMQALSDLGCSSLAEADERLQELDAEIQTRLADVREQLASTS